MPVEWKLKYAGGDVDRRGVARKDAAWVESMRAHPSARVVPVFDARNLVDLSQSEQPRAWLPRFVDVPALQAAELDWALLGTRDEVPYFAVAPSAESEFHALEQLGIAGAAEFLDIRRIGALLDNDEAALMAYARGMMHWHAQQRYCGRCGSATESLQAGHVLRCTGAACARESYPRTDPAVIMLVTQKAQAGHPARCLLGRDQRFPPGVFSTLAGFVEPGESLEEAVAREVHEEAGIRVHAVTYRASQPWPFPSSIMLGFEAQALTDTIAIDPDEIAEAHWFTAQQLAEFGSWEDDSAARRLPRKDSIARQLIDGWLARVA